VRGAQQVFGADESAVKWRAVLDRMGESDSE
jgi:hypothetical protein